MSANRSTSSADRNAASPSGSGHCETAPALNAVPGLSVKWCRGSVESVIGILRGVLAASSWSRLCHPATSCGCSTTPSKLKWVILRLSTRSSVLGKPKAGSASARVPSGPMPIWLWNSCPALSSSDMRDSRSSARRSGASAGSRYGCTGGMRQPFGLDNYVLLRTVCVLRACLVRPADGIAR